MLTPNFNGARSLESYKYGVYVIMVAILLVAFGLRVSNSTVADLDLDETWTYLHHEYLQYPDGFTQFIREPNNTVHITMMVGVLEFVPDRLGARLLSLMAGILSVAVTARIGYRLFNTKVALASAVLSAFAFLAIDISQTARPYALANLFGLMALLTWIEAKPRWNTLFSALAPLFHVGAMPLVILQDAYTVIAFIQGKKVKLLNWIVFRLPSYLFFIMMLILVWLRHTTGKTISSGQGTPSFINIVSDLTRNIFGTLRFSLETPHILFWLAICGVVGYAFLRKSYRNQLIILFLWVLLSYGSLIIMTIISSGPIKFIHITHITYAIALMVGFALYTLPSRSLPVGLTLISIFQIAGLFPYYQEPIQQYQESGEAIVEWYDSERSPLYFRLINPVNGLMVNASSDALLDILAVMPEEQPPDRYYYLQFRSFRPYYDDTCDPTPVWTYWDFDIHRCETASNES